MPQRGTASRFLTGRPEITCQVALAQVLWVVMLHHVWMQMNYINIHTATWTVGGQGVSYPGFLRPCSGLAAEQPLHPPRDRSCDTQAGPWALCTSSEFW